MRTLLTGATGFVGSRLLSMLGETIAVSRDPARSSSAWPASVQPLRWDPAGSEFPHEALLENPPAAVVNLMGESVAEGRWTSEKKNRIRNSRVVGTNKLVDGLLKLPSPPQVLVNASAVGIYGDRGEEILTENSPVASGDFLSDVCLEWEQAARRLADSGVRVVTIRIGIVIGRDGGAMKKLVPLFRWCLGGRLGSGQQWMPWIHLDDLCRMIVWTIEDETIKGPINGCSPNPVRNREFTRSLAGAVSRPAIIPAPSFGLRLILGEFATTLLNSQRVVPELPLARGFEFRFPVIDEAISDSVK